MLDLISVSAIENFSFEISELFPEVVFLLMTTSYFS